MQEFAPVEVMWTSKFPSELIVLAETEAVTEPANAEQGAIKAMNNEINSLVDTCLESVFMLKILHKKHLLSRWRMA